MSNTSASRDPHAARKDKEATHRTRVTVLFIGGAGFGLLVGFYWLGAMRDPGLFVGGIFVFAAFAGWLSARFGVRFWEWLAEYGRWLFR